MADPYLDSAALVMPTPNDHGLRILSPEWLELVLVNRKDPDPARPQRWDFVDSQFQFVAPPLSAFAVTVEGQAVSVTEVAFKRRPLFAPLAGRDLRLHNSLLLRLASPVSDGQTVEVRNPAGDLWPATFEFLATAEPLRYSPAIHVNQHGYLPRFPKQAMIGFYLGNRGELSLDVNAGFKLVEARTGVEVFQGALVARPDIGYNYSPTPYQQVFAADFTAFETPGEYRLHVPGLGASLPFRIDEGVAMAFARTYALGLYHQRCGAANEFPFTRCTHAECHTAPAEVPSPQTSFAFTWSAVAQASSDYAKNPRHTAPQLQDEASQLYPFVRTGSLDVSRGHHDAGDYSKYTINSAGLVHYLVFSADALAGVGELDNLGLPESGDGISDLLQIAKWEADFLVKMQDDDGGFYFLVYPRERRYEHNVLPDQGDPQVVWPKNTSATAAAVAALAQTASSPRFKQHFPEAAALYLAAAERGWNFLSDAIARFGKDGSYQKLTHYGDVFMHDDELAWAACELFLATGNAAYHDQLRAWFDPADPNTRRWGWWRLWESYGRATRSYAFAARTGRLAAGQLDAVYLARCEAEVRAAAQDHTQWASESAYGTSFPSHTKRVRAGGWYFSTDRAFDIAVAWQLDPRAEWMEAILSNLNYEGGGNPANAVYVTGLGAKRQREIVHQYAQNDGRVLPPTGIPIGNLQAGFSWVNAYGTELRDTCFPSDGATVAPYPFYDRWGDVYNVTTEFVHMNQARSLGGLAFLAGLTETALQPWRAASASILVPAQTRLDSPISVILQAPGMDLSEATVVWEARDHEPAFGSSHVLLAPRNNGQQWVEAEAHWPDGRRVFARASFAAETDTLLWVDDALPAGAVPSVGGGDVWNWIDADPSPLSGSLAHQSALVSGLHQHYFDGATDTLAVNEGDTLFTWIYLDPANPPAEVMLQWNDGTWEHRAYWGANLISYGKNGTTSRCYMGELPPTGRWVRLDVPASAVALEGRVVKGMSFALYDGRATWDAAGKFSPVTADPLPLVIVEVAEAVAEESTGQAGVFNILRAGNVASDLLVSYTLEGTAVNGTDYERLDGMTIIPAGSARAEVVIRPLADGLSEAPESVILTILSSDEYVTGAPASAAITIIDNSLPMDELPIVTVSAADASASRVDLDPGAFSVQRAGSVDLPLTVELEWSGTAAAEIDFTGLEGPVPTSVTIPAGVASVDLAVIPLASSQLVFDQTIILTVTEGETYAIGEPRQETVALVGNQVPISSIKNTGSGTMLTWNSTVGKTYRVASKDNLSDAVWTDLSPEIIATSESTTWRDRSVGKWTMRYYVVYVLD